MLARHNRQNARKLAGLKELESSSKKRDSLGDEYGLSGRHVARLMRVNQTIPEIKEVLDKGEM